jgi:hypothetical protein
VQAGGGYTHTGGLVSTTWISDTKYLGDLAYPNIYANGSANFYKAEERALLLAARAGGNALGAFKSLHDVGPSVTVPAATNKTQVAVSVFNQGFNALVGYRVGLTAAAVIQGGSVDTHSHHDVLQPRNIQGLLWGVDLLMREAGDGDKCRTTVNYPFDQRTRKSANSPVAFDQIVCTSSTRAHAGPSLHHRARDSSADFGPSASASTEPSGRLRTQPVRPRLAAVSRVLTR